MNGFIKNNAVLGNFSIKIKSFHFFCGIFVYFGWLGFIYDSQVANRSAMGEGGSGSPPCFLSVAWESYTGCSIVPCSAISQASCRSPDDRRGAALPQEDVGGHVGVSHTQKVSRKSGNGDQSGQTPSGNGDPLRHFSRRRFCDAVWVRLRVLFFK